MESLIGTIEYLDKKVRGDGSESELRLINQQKACKDAIEENAKAIEQIDSKLELFVKKETKCRYFNKGYCRLKTNCDLYHPKQICKTFDNTGMCSQTFCSDRHQRICKYWTRGVCYRGDSCHFRHRIFDQKPIEDNMTIKNIKTCDRCRKTSQQSYYCEFCYHDFCSLCTNEAAHTNDFVDKFLRCEKIHKTDGYDLDNTCDKMVINNEMEQDCDIESEEFDHNLNMAVTSTPDKY